MKTTDNVPQTCAVLLDGAAKTIHTAAETAVWDRTRAIEMLGEVEGVVREVAIQLRSAAIV